MFLSLLGRNKIEWNAIGVKKIKVVYHEPVTGPRSWGIVNRIPAINNKLTTKPTPKPNPNPILTLP